MSNLILVRHAAPQVTPALPASAWRLSAAGRASCAALAEHLFPLRPTAIITSTEPKAIETGQLIAERLKAPCRSAPDLHEHRRDAVGYFEQAVEFEDRVARFFGKPARVVFGDESADEVYRRFSRAVDSVVSAYNYQPVVIVTHGTAMSLFIARKTGMDAYALWRALGLPAFAVLGLPGYRLLRLVEHLTPPANET